jgi:hypothetical protein
LEEKALTVRLEDLDREPEWIILLDRRDIDIEILGRKSSSIVRLDLDFFARVVGPQLKLAPSPWHTGSYSHSSL